MLARAIGLASILGEDAAALARLPEPYGRAAEAARARLQELPRAARAAAIARETMALFSAPSPAGARRVLPRGLRTALAPPEPPPIAALGAPPAWLLTALAGCERLGAWAIARASAAAVEGTPSAPLPAPAELLRRLPPDEAARVVALRRRGLGSPDALAAGQMVTALALGFEQDGGPPLVRSAGLCRIAWAASTEPEARTWLGDTLPEPEAALVGWAANALWFAAAEHAAAERARIDTDLGEAP